MFNLWLLLQLWTLCDFSDRVSFLLYLSSTLKRLFGCLQKFVMIWIGGMYSNLKVNSWQWWEQELERQKIRIPTKRIFCLKERPLRASSSNSTTTSSKKLWIAQVFCASWQVVCIHPWIHQPCLVIGITSARWSVIRGISRIDHKWNQNMFTKMMKE